MKSTVKKEEVKNDKPFPKLMRGKETGIIVLFVSEKVGTVVNLDEHQRGKNEYRLGLYNPYWNTSTFEDFNGEVTLSND